MSKSRFENFDFMASSQIFLEKATSTGSLPRFVNSDERQNSNPRKSNKDSSPNDGFVNPSKFPLSSYHTPRNQSPEPRNRSYERYKSYKPREYRYQKKPTISQTSTFYFKQRKERLDWRMLGALQVEKIVREVDIERLQEAIDNITFCDIEAEDLRYVDPNIVKLFQLSQLVIEYLLYSQEFLYEQKTAAAEESATMNAKFKLLNDEFDAVVDEMKALKKDNKSLKKSLYTLQLMAKQQPAVPKQTVNPMSVQRCPYCSKLFNTHVYLESHVFRRHPDMLSDFANYTSTSPGEFPAYTMRHPQPRFVDRHTSAPDIQPQTPVLNVEEIVTKLSETILNFKNEIESKIEQELKEKQEMIEKSLKMEQTRREEELKTIKNSIQQQLQDSKFLFEKEKQELHNLLNVPKPKISHIGKLEDDIEETQKASESLVRRESLVAEIQNIHAEIEKVQHSYEQKLQVETNELLQRVKNQQSFALDALSTQLASDMEKLKMSVLSEHDEERKKLEDRLSSANAQMQTLQSALVDEKTQSKQYNQKIKELEEENKFPRASSSSAKVVSESQITVPDFKNIELPRPKEFLPATSFTSSVDRSSVVIQKPAITETVKPISKSSSLIQEESATERSRGLSVTQVNTSKRVFSEDEIFDLLKTHIQTPLPHSPWVKTLFPQQPARITPHRSIISGEVDEQLNSRSEIFRNLRDTWNLNPTVMAEYNKLKIVYETEMKQKITSSKLYKRVYEFCQEQLELALKVTDNGKNTPVDYTVFGAKMNGQQINSIKKPQIITKIDSQSSVLSNTPVTLFQTRQQNSPLLAQTPRPKGVPANAVDVFSPQMMNPTTPRLPGVFNSNLRETQPAEETSSRNSVKFTQQLSAGNVVVGHSIVNTPGSVIFEQGSKKKLSNEEITTDSKLLPPPPSAPAPKPTIITSPPPTLENNPVAKNIASQGLPEKKIGEKIWNNVLPRSLFNKTGKNPEIMSPNSPQIPGLKDDKSTPSDSTDDDFTSSEGDSLTSEPQDEQKKPINVRQIQVNNDKPLPEPAPEPKTEEKPKIVQKAETVTAAIKSSFEKGIATISNAISTNQTSTKSVVIERDVKVSESVVEVKDKSGENRKPPLPPHINTKKDDDESELTDTEDISSEDWPEGESLVDDNDDDWDTSETSEVSPIVKKRSLAFDDIKAKQNHSTHTIMEVSEEDLTEDSVSEKGSKIKMDAKTDLLKNLPTAGSTHGKGDEVTPIQMLKKSSDSSFNISELSDEISLSEEKTPKAGGKSESDSGSNFSELDDLIEEISPTKKYTPAKKQAGLSNVTTTNLSKSDSFSFSGEDLHSESIKKTSEVRRMSVFSGKGFTSTANQHKQLPIKIVDDSDSDFD
ncbi:Zinc finger protein dzip1 [Nowakowskiella sp. JEL0407]|nr:Zinc finger protein dzip1 [Nowakowskiella sp. JEL0407]